MKTGIVLEGGAVRTIFSTGVCDALLTRDLLPDYVIGVSAGIAYGVSYVSKQSRRNLDIMVNYINDKRYMGFGNLLRRDNRAYFGLDFVFGTCLLYTSYQCVHHDLHRFHRRGLPRGHRRRAGCICPDGVCGGHASGRQNCRRLC